MSAVRPTQEDDASFTPALFAAVSISSAVLGLYAELNLAGVKLPPATNDYCHHRLTERAHRL